MPLSRRFVPIILLLSLLLLSACANQRQNTAAVTNLYCDRYLLYRMCTLDATANGRADFIYFEDSQEIFLFDPDTTTFIPENLTMHHCAQSMDTALLNATSLLLTVNDTMSFFERSEIKNKIFYHYMRYLPRVNRCNNEKNDSEDTDFSDQEDPFFADS